MGTAHDGGPPRWTRRELGLAGAALGLAGLVGAGRAPTTAAAGAALPDLPPLPASAAPFDAAGRRDLAMDALTFFVQQQGLFPGRAVYQLPAAPWLDGYQAVTPRQAWDMAVPAGVPLYLLAAANSAGPIDPASTTVSVNGVALGGLAAYVHGGVPALFAGRTRDHAVLDLVFAPAAPGRYRIEVKTRCVPRSSGAEGAPPSRDAVDEALLVYDVSVRPADALGPRLFRDGSGSVYATLGSERRRLPDPETLQALGYPPEAISSASAAFLAAIPEGQPLPELREGMLVRAADDDAVFRLVGGRRRWLKDAAPGAPASLDFAAAPDDPGPAPDVRVLDAPVLQTIPPVLQPGMLIKGAAPDVYHVDGTQGGTLRKVPDGKWLADHKLRADDVLYVPDRIIAALPQNSPHWVMPGGAWFDRSFYSDALARSMPYRVYLPPGYAAAGEAGQRYPVLYLLHGMGGRYDEWSGYGIEEVANELLADGKFARVIIVMPQGGLGYWMNQDGGTLWADYVARDVVSHVEATYRTLPKREARAVGGLSMGAHGAVQLALNYPTVFGIAGAHSPSIRTLDSAPAYFGGESGFALRDPISLVKSSRLANSPQLWIDAGDKDFWKPGAAALHQALQAKGWSHEWHVFSGEHDGWYWADHIWEYLPFYVAALQKGGVPLSR